MRTELKRLDGLRIRFRAKVKRYGTKTNYHGYPERTILFTDIAYADTKEIVSDHVWFTCGKTINCLGLKEGDQVEFDARVGDYTKLDKSLIDYGIREFVIDYKLKNPTRIVKI